MSNECNERFRATPLEVADVDMGYDAVFLPSKIHGCDWQVYVMFGVYDGGEEPYIQLMKLSYEDILEAADYASTQDPCAYDGAFWDMCAELSGGNTYSIPFDSEYGRDLQANYPTADFIGGGLEEIEFLIRWAKNYQRTKAC